MKNWFFQCDRTLGFKFADLQTVRNLGDSEMITLVFQPINVGEDCDAREVDARTAENAMVHWIEFSIQELGNAPI